MLNSKIAVIGDDKICHSLLAEKLKFFLLLVALVFSYIFLCKINKNIVVENSKKLNKRRKFEQTTTFWYVVNWFDPTVGRDCAIRTNKNIFSPKSKKKRIEIASYKSRIDNSTIQSS